MKKILIGRGLEERAAVCSFCGDSKEDCVKGSVPLEVESPKFIIENYAILNVGKHFKVSTFSSNYYQIPEGEEKCGGIMVKGETVKLTDDADICKDCIRQLAKQI